MANNPADESLSTLAAPLGELIAAVGRGVADAQKALDRSTIETIKALYAGNDENLNLMRRMGFQPTWYRIPELDAEITASLSVTRNARGTGNASGPLQMYLSPVDATYSNSYDYKLEAASVIRFKVVPVPPPSQAAEMKIMPAIADKPMKDAGEMLAEMGVPFETKGTGAKVVRTDPIPGELILPGRKVTLTLGT